MEKPTREWIDAQGGHWGQHLVYKPEDWREQVAAEDTRLGYWEWAFDMATGLDNEPEQFKTGMKDSIGGWIDRGKLVRFTWPGGYPVMYLNNNGAMICPRCAQLVLFDDTEEKYKPQVGFPIMEGPNVVCEKCRDKFEMTYGDIKVTRKAAIEHEQASGREKR